MKKATRLIALFTALALLCLSATGCDALDEMREAQIFYTADGGIKVGDTEYLPLPFNEYLSPVVDRENAFYVTNEDVPVLLSSIVGERFYSYNDGLLLSSNYIEEYYCREDQYDEVYQQAISHFDPTGYCYTYEILNEETFGYAEYNYHLTDAQAEVIDQVLTAVEGVERADNAHYTYDYGVSLDACTDNMLFREWWYDIEKTNGNYYIVDFNDPSSENGVEYAVPFEYNAVFDAIVKNMIDAEKAEEQYYSDLYGYDDGEYDIDYEVI